MTTTSSTPDLAEPTTEHPNARRARGAFEAFARGDLETVRQHLTDDATWTVSGSGPFAGTRRGWSEIYQTDFAAFAEVTGGTARAEVQSVLADDRHAVVIHDLTSTVAGRTETFRVVHVQEVTPDGRAKAVRLFFYDQEAFDRHLRAQAG